MPNVFKRFFRSKKSRKKVNHDHKVGNPNGALQEGHPGGQSSQEQEQQQQQQQGTTPTPPVKKELTKFDRDNLIRDHFPDFDDIISPRDRPRDRHNDSDDSHDEDSDDEEDGDDDDEEDGEEEEDAEEEYYNSEDDDEDDDDTDDDEALKRKEKKYNYNEQTSNSAEDQDVLVFLKMCERMSLSSYLHLLQGHVREAHNLSPDCLQPYKEIAKLETVRRQRSITPAAVSASSSSTNPPKRSSSVTSTTTSSKKKFRFAEITGNQVRAIVYEVECWKELEDVWWKPEEMRCITKELVDMVQFFRKHRLGYIQAVEIVAREIIPQITPKRSNSTSSSLNGSSHHSRRSNNRKDNAATGVSAGAAGAADSSASASTSTSSTSNLVAAKQQLIEHHMKILTQDYPHARGCEAHIVKLLSNNRRDTIKAILNEQMECQLSAENFDKTSKELRCVSMAYSAMSSRLAQRMAQCDEIDALKASMSKWEAVPI